MFAALSSFENVLGANSKEQLVGEPGLELAGADSLLSSRELCAKLGGLDGPAGSPPPTEGSARAARVPAQPQRPQRSRSEGPAAPAPGGSCCLQEFNSGVRLGLISLNSPRTRRRHQPVADTKSGRSTCPRRGQCGFRTAGHHPAVLHVPVGHVLKTDFLPF